MTEQIQDEIFKRVLDLLGLRGTVQHSYEPTITPVVTIGDMSSRVIWQRNLNNVATQQDIFVVPQGEVWRPIMMKADLVQSAGTVAPRWQFIVLSGPGATFITHYLPASFEGSGSISGGKVIAFIGGLNSTVRAYLDFPHDVLLPSGARFQVQTGVGDGTLQWTDGSIMYQRLLEPSLVDLRLT